MASWQDSLERYLGAKGRVIADSPSRPEYSSTLDDVGFATRYALMTTDQVPSHTMAEWLRDPSFATYVSRRRGGSAQGSTKVSDPSLGERP